MSTPLGSDLAGLLEAIERGDLGYQLALYAADAELRVAGCDPTGLVSVYRGRDAIRAGSSGLRSSRSPTGSGT